MARPRLDAGQADPLATLREVIELFPVGVLLVAGDEPLTASRLAFNASYARLMSIPADTLPEEVPLGNYYYPDRRTLVPKDQWVGRRAIATGEEVHNEEVHLLSFDGAWRVLLMSAAPVWHEGRVRGALVVVRDASTLHRAKEKARASEEQALRRTRELEILLDTVPAAVFMTHDRDSRSVQLNRFGAEILGVPPGTNVSMGAPTDQRTGRFRALRNGVEVPSEELPVQVAARDGVQVMGAEFELVLDDGTTRHLLGNASVIRGTHGESQGAVGAFIDITERRRAEEALRDADRRKSEFLAILSHELRNPLAPIQNAFNVLERADPTSEQAARARTVIGRQVRHLTRLVDDLLDVTRISRGKVQLVRVRTDLEEVVRRTVEDHRSMFVKREVSLELREPHGAAYVDGDAARLSQVVANLLLNAAKFTDPGGHVVVSVEREGPHALVRVKDDGAGIAPDMADVLFEPFMQADQTLDRSRGGLGLGLALVKGVVELHGGSVHARSNGVGTGAEFVVSLPAAADPAQETSRPDEPRASAPRRVLVVEDNEDSAATLRDLLELEGHEILVALDGQRGLDTALATRPDVVLCDLGLPGFDGYEVARRLRAAGSDAVLVALTGYAAPEDAERARESGFDHHLAKPPDLAKLARIIAQAESRSGR